MHNESAIDTPGARRQLSTGQVAATVLLLLCHGAIMLFGFVLSFGLVMGTDVCAYVECGEEKWAGYAAALAIFGGLALLLTDLVVSVAFLATRRPTASMVPLIACGVHVVLLVVAFVMADMAGPIK